MIRFLSRFVYSLCFLLHVSYLCPVIRVAEERDVVSEVYNTTTRRWCMWECKVCQGNVESMGILGNLAHGRCRQCGLDQSLDVRKNEWLLPPAEEEEEKDELGTGPVYRHDCDSCLYLGHFEEHDLYYCGCPAQSPHRLPTVIARWGGEGPEYYASGLEIAKVMDFKSMENNAPAYSRALRVAYLIARDAGKVS
jgi:hypothetical protein